MPGPRHRAMPARAMRRRLRGMTAAALAAGLALAAGGCATFDAALGKREAVVHFQPGTSATARLNVRAACSHVPHVTAEPLPTSHALSAQLNDVRYLVSNATDAELAQLQTCLQRFPSVTGIYFNTPGTSGG